MVKAYVKYSCMLFCISFSLKVISACLPKDLEEVAQLVGCSPLDNAYFSREGMIYPPYLYGYPLRANEEEMRAVFFCHQKDRKKYLLVFVKGRKPYHDSCPPVIELDGYPLGLSVIHKPKIPLSQFVYLDNPLKQGPKGKFTEYDLLRDGTDSLERNFYCHEGKWLYRLLH